MDTKGNLYVDYRIDLNHALEEYKHDYQKGDDIRYLLAENTPFVPAYSLPYTIQDGEPVFQVSVKSKNNHIQSLVTYIVLQGIFDIVLRLRV